MHAPAHLGLKAISLSMSDFCKYRLLDLVVTGLGKLHAKVSVFRGWYVQAAMRFLPNA
jgi:hypothetical protein